MNVFRGVVSASELTVVFSPRANARYIFYLAKNGKSFRICPYGPSPNGMEEIPSELFEAMRDCKTHATVLAFLQELNQNKENPRFPINAYCHYNTSEEGHTQRSDGAPAHFCSLDKQIKFVQNKILNPQPTCSCIVL